MIESSQFVWFDGELVPSAEAKVHVLSHTLHYGFGVFEGIRSYRVDETTGAVFRLDAHCRRMADTMRMSGLKSPASATELAEACVETLRKNRLVEAYVRPICYLGPGSMDTVSTKNPLHLAVGVWEWGPYLGAEGLANGIRCSVSSFSRIGLSDHLPKGKIVGHYVNSILAKDEAKRLGFDEALLADRDGHVLEGSGENLFFVRDGVVITPPLESNILAGVTRDSVLTLARELGLRAEERLFGRDSLYLADEVFLTGTAAEVTPVREIDGRAIGSGRPGPVTRRLQECFLSVVKTPSAAHAEWRTVFRI